MRYYSILTFTILCVAVVGGFFIVHKNNPKIVNTNIQQICTPDKKECGDRTIKEEIVIVPTEIRGLL